MQDGGYDSFDQAREVVERLYRLGAEASAVDLNSDRFQQIKREVFEVLAEDLEHVSRLGVIRGPEKFVADWELQLERFTVSSSIETMDGGDAVVVLSRVRRQSRENPKDYFTARSGVIYRVRNGRIVFLEGFPDGRDALEAAGLAPT